MNIKEAKEQLSPEEFEDFIDACDAHNSDLVPYYDLDPDLESSMDDVMHIIDVATKIISSNDETQDIKTWQRILREYTEYYEEHKND
mgnify:CR=1 FL=1